MVSMAVIAVRPEVSLVSTLLRFYEMSQRGTIPRATAMEAHDLVVAALPENLDALAAVTAISAIGIWTRDQKMIYNSKTATERPSETLRRFWSRPWTEEERQRIRADIELLRENEKQMQLGQGDAIDALEQRVNRAITQNNQTR